MKSLLLLPLLGAFAAAAVAQTESMPQEVDSVTIPANSVRIAIPDHARRMSAEDFAVYRGAYDLANGQTLYLTAQGTRLFAEVDDSGRSEIVSAGRGTFVALDQRMKMRFERADNGDVGGELTIAKTPALAGRPLEYLMMAARR
ncbi:MAG: hypothetical protein V4724_27840 [Pseudomonadota bacterium]